MKDKTIIINKLINSDFKEIQDLDSFSLNYSGLYCIKMKEDCVFPNKRYQDIFCKRKHKIIYIGKGVNLANRLIAEDLQHRGPSTFFRAIGTILGFSPIKRNGNSRSSINNYIFDERDTLSIIKWMEENLEVSYVKFDISDVDLRKLEKSIIESCRPFLNDSHNPLRLKELRGDRDRYRKSLQQ